MPIIVEIEGKGEVAEFPDGTDQAIIDAAIKRDYFTAPPQEPTFSAGPEAIGPEEAPQAMGYAAEAIDLPFKPLHWVRDAVTGLMKKVPTLAEPVKGYEPVPGMEEFLQEQGALKRTGGETIPAEVIPEVAELAAYPAYMKGIGIAARGVTRAPLTALGKIYGKEPIDLYMSALKGSTLLSQEERVAIFNEMVKRNFPVTNTALKNLKTNLKESLRPFDELIEKAGAESVELTVDGIVREIDTAAERFRRAGMDTTAFRAQRDRFIEAHPTGRVNIKDARAIKSDLYAWLDDSYGQLESASKEAMKALARGTVKQTVELFPELAEAGMESKTLIELEEVLQRALNRINNRDVLGLAEGTYGIMGAAAQGKLGAAAGLALRKIADHPGVKSKLAIALAKRGVPNPEKVIHQRLYSTTFPPSKPVRLTQPPEPTPPTPTGAMQAGEATVSPYGGEAADLGVMPREPSPTLPSPVVAEGQAPRPAVSPGPEPNIGPPAWQAPQIVTRPGEAPPSTKVGAPLKIPVPPTGKAVMPPKPEEFFSMFPGAMAGVETDDQGNQTFSIGKAVAGMVAAGAGAKLVNKMVKAYKVGHVAEGAGKVKPKLKK